MRLMVESTMMPPGRTRAAQALHEGADVGHMLHDLEANHSVKLLTLGGEVFDGRDPVVDGEALGLGMGAGDGNVLVAGVDAGHGRHPSDTAARK